MLEDIEVLYHSCIRMNKEKMITDVINNKNRQAKEFVLLH